MLKKLIVGLLLVIILSIVTFIGINATDEDLTPEVKAILELPKVETSPGLIEGFKYLLAIRVPGDLDPKVEGEALYKVLEANEMLSIDQKTKIEKNTRALNATTSGFPGKCQNQFCSKEDLVELNPQLAQAVENNRLLLERFDYLISHYDGAASPLRPSLFLPDNSSTVYSLMKIKILQFNQRLVEGQVKEVAADMTKINNFLVETLASSHSLVSISIYLTTLRTLRDVVKNAENAIPDLKTELVALGFKNLQLPFEQIQDNVIRGELTIMNEILTFPLNLEYTSLDYDQEQSPFWREAVITVLNRVFSLGYKRQHSLNLYYTTIKASSSNPCIQSEVKCVFGEPQIATGNSFYNPVGKRLVRSFGSMPTTHFQKIYGHVKALSEPL